MTPAPQRDVHCPRCRYNLRGLTTPRCPECGFEFSFEDFRTGLLRENIPTWLDRCDPWQPHQVLLRTLYELLRGVLRPRRLLAKLDVNGPLTPAWLMLVCGVLWLWLLTSAIMTVAIVWHAGASPATASKAAAFVHAPRILLSTLTASVGLLPLALLPQAISVAHATLRQEMRLSTYSVPTFASYGCLACALASCGLPDFALAVPGIWPPLSYIAGLLGLPGPLWRRGVSARRLAAAFVTHLAFFVLAVMLAKLLLPASLDPPQWIYAI